MLGSTSADATVNGSVDGNGEGCSLRSYWSRANELVAKRVERIEVRLFMRKEGRRIWVSMFKRLCERASIELKGDMVVLAEQGVSRLLLLLLKLAPIGRRSILLEATPRLAVIKGAGKDDPTVDEKDEWFFSWRKLLRATRGRGSTVAGAAFADMVAAVVAVDDAGDRMQGGGGGAAR